MAKAKYTVENFNKELMELRQKYKRVADEDISSVLGFFFHFCNMEWQDFMSAYRAAIQMDIHEPKVKEKLSPKKPKRKVGRPKKKVSRS